MDDWKEKFQQVNQELEVLKKKHTDFLEAASHDLHAPLRKISVILDRITEKNATDPQAMQYISRIRNSVSEMQSLLDNLSGLAIATSGTFQYSDCDLNVILEKIQFELQEEIEEKKVIMNWPVLPVLKADAIQYKQLFLSIIENAIKFSEKNTAPQIDINVNLITAEEAMKHKLKSTEKYHKIEIADKGIGFPPEYAERIFEPCVRLHPKSDYPGTGLGLSIAKKIVENHNGIIYAEGNEDVGAKFILILPANQ